MSTIITKITYNWFYTTDTRDGGECYDAFTVGESGVISIDEHLPKGEGDRWCYIVNFENGERRTIFNPNVVIEKEV